MKLVPIFKDVSYKILNCYIVTMVTEKSTLFSFKKEITSTYRLICTSKATPVSRSKGWCSIRIIVSIKVTLIRRRTANNNERNVEASTGVLFCVQSVFLLEEQCRWALSLGSIGNVVFMAVCSLSLLYRLSTHTVLTHPSQWFVQTFQVLPAELVAPGLVALLKPLVGPSGTPGPAACWRSYLMTSLGSPIPRLWTNKATGDVVILLPSKALGWN